MYKGVIKGIENIISNPTMGEGEMVFQIKNMIYHSEIENSTQRESNHIYDLLSKNLENIKNGMMSDKVFKTGFTDLDTYIGGFSFGEFIVIGSRPGMGKMTLLVNLVLNISKDIPVLYFTFDQSESHLSNRFLSTLTKIPIHKITQHKLTNEEKELIYSMEESIKLHKIFINNSCNDSITQLINLCTKHILENGVKVIVIDFLQIIGSNRNRYGRELEISFVCRQLKNLAKEHDICIIAASHLNRRAESREGNRPHLSDLSESGSIESHADKVLMLYRPDYYGICEDVDGNSTQNIIELQIQKNKNGPLDTIKLMRDSEFTTIMDYINIPQGFIISQNRLNELAQFKASLMDLDNPPF